MKILVTGGTGVLGTGTVTELLRRGHTVVLLSRHAESDATQWTAGVVAWNGDVAKAESATGSADGCDAVLHMAGIIEESPPDTTFDGVNAAGTRNIVAEATRAGVRRFVYVSSLGADVGESDYHRSKREGESYVRGFDGNWTICRPGNVYGPGDEQISMLLQLVRGVSSLVPKIGDGDQPFQPLWWEDAAAALVNIVERTDLGGEALDIAGAEVTTQTDLMERFSRITGRNVHGVPIPEVIASLGARFVSLVGWDVNMTSDQLQMLKEGNVIRPGRVNALSQVLDVEPTALDAGLRALADLQPEQLPDEGIGALKRKRFWADISGCNCSAELLFSRFAERFAEVTPVFVEVGAEPRSPVALEDGATITLALPMRGHVQVRATALEANGVVLLTLKGHPLAGAVRFLSEDRGNAVRFQIEIYERAANIIDYLAMRTVGERLQDHTWSQVIDNVIALGGGTAEQGVEHDAEVLDDAAAKHVLEWLERLIVERKRAENAEAIRDRPT